MLLTEEVSSAVEYDLKVGIGDAARIIGVPAHTIRFWEKEFAFYLKPDRTDGKQRRYNEEDLEKLGRIFRMLKEEGYSIAGAKRALLLQFREPQKDWDGGLDKTIADKILDLVRLELNLK